MVLNSFPPVTNSLVTQCTPVGFPIILPQGGQPPLQLAAISDPFFSPPFPSNQVPTPPQEPRQFVSLPYYDPQPPPTITQDFHAPAPSQSSVHQTAAIHHQDLNSHPLVHRTASSPARVSRQPAPYRILSSAVAGTSCQLHVAPESVSNLQVAQNDTLASGLPAPQMSEPRRRYKYRQIMLFAQKLTWSQAREIVYRKRTESDACRHVRSVAKPGTRYIAVSMIICKFQY